MALLWDNARVVTAAHSVPTIVVEDSILNRQLGGKEGFGCVFPNLTGAVADPMKDFAGHLQIKLVRLHRVKSSAKDNVPVYLRIELASYALSSPWKYMP